MQKQYFFLFTFILMILPVFIADESSYAREAESEPEDNYDLQVYLRKDEALNQVFPDCDEIITDEIVMSPEEKQHLEKILRRRLYESKFTVYIGLKKDKIQGYAIITQEIGKFRPFTFIVGVKPNGKINEIAVLVYRESRGGEIVRKRFLYQFIGKSFKNPVRINRDIINITGATMSVRYLCAGVRKVLGVINEYYLSGKRDMHVNRLISDETEPKEKEKETVRIDNKRKKTGGKTKIVALGNNGGNEKNINSSVKLLKQTRMIMGTFAEVSLYSDDLENAGKAINAALDEMERMDALLSNYKEDSQLSQLNKKAVKYPVPCNKELFDFIERSLYYSKISNGAFDITVSPIVDLWGFFYENGHIPSNDEIKRVLPAVSYKNIEINKSDNQEERSTVFFRHTLTQIDPGAIGKGYAVDKALAVIRDFGIDNACINLGGNMYLSGKPADRNAWRIGVQHPRNKNELLGYLELKNEATATSGDYERFFEIDGERYSHIIDPRTGRPVKGTIAVTIVASSGTQVDALSTCVFVLGPKEGLELVEKLTGVEALIAFERDKEIIIHMTQGFRERFTGIEDGGKDNVKWHVLASGK